MIFRSLFLVVLIAAIAGTHASPLSTTRSLQRPRCHKQPRLICVLRPTDGHKVLGVVRFRAVRNRAYRPWRRNSRGCNVRVSAKVLHLTAGPHGMHAHAFGDERETDGSSLGPHFANPWSRPVNHGLRADRVRHWGDFGNIVARADGVARLRYVDRVITIKGIVGRGIIVHGGEDKGAAFQPSGASGPRVASCVIGYENTEM